jgi:hypothetical protein
MPAVMLEDTDKSKITNRRGWLSRMGTMNPSPLYNEYMLIKI